MSDKIVVMGGAFDPPHLGHLTAASCALDAFGASKAVFMPLGTPPHKREITEREARFEMAALAAGSDPRFEASRIEIDRPGVTYTVDTLAELRKLYGGAELLFVAGTDALAYVPQWKDAELAVEMCTLAVTRRGGHDGGAFEDAVNAVTAMGGVVKAFDMPEMALSSTLIRERAGRGESVAYLVPSAVERFIRDRRLYGGGNGSGASVEGRVVDYLREHVKPKRFTHIMGVAQTAVRLALVYGVSAEKAYLAGLLHDVAKGLSDDAYIEYCKRNMLEVDDEEYNAPDTLHAAVGADMAEREFGVADRDVLAAVRWHCCARARMSELEKIIYIADVTEPGRHNPASDALRPKQFDGLDAAFLEAMRLKVSHVEACGEHVFSSTKKAIKHMTKGVNKNV